MLSIIELNPWLTKTEQNYDVTLLCFGHIVYK